MFRLSYGWFGTTLQLECLDEAAQLDLQCLI
jgi:hypothetical protein